MRGIPFDSFIGFSTIVLVRKGYNTLDLRLYGINLWLSQPINHFCRHGFSFKSNAFRHANFIINSTPGISDNVIGFPDLCITL